LDAVWSKIPQGIDILLTHGPPFGILDRVQAGDRVGCEDLLRHVERVRPAIHCFGHIHEAYGFRKLNGTLFLNPSICTLHYYPTQLPMVVNWESREQYGIVMEE
jgi:Icc-related predicted phosphoesterase